MFAMKNQHAQGGSICPGLPGSVSSGLPGSISPEFTLPILRTTLGHFLVEILKHFADVKLCYITGNNSQSYSGY